MVKHGLVSTASMWYPDLENLFNLWSYEEIMVIDLSDVQKKLDWLKELLYLNANVLSAKSRLVKRGQVYRCNFGSGIGSEMQKDRPAVIIQNDPSNRTSGNTIVIPITHDTAKLLCMVPITTQLDSQGNILLDGQANTSNLMCVSKARLGNYICDLSAGDMKLIDEALAKTVDLMKYYANMQTQYNSKVQHLAIVKNARNQAQDELKAIRNELGISEAEDILEAIKRLKR